MSRITSDPQQAADCLNSGKLVAFPTETVYGLGADARNPRAVAGIFEVKERPAFDPLIVHVRNRAAVHEVVSEFPAIAERLAETFWPGPLTLVLPKRGEIPDLVTAGLPGVGIRVPAHPLAQELLERSGRPIAAPSANKFGRISPTTAAHVQEGLGVEIDLILDGGPCSVGLESTVLSLMGDHPVLLRPGGCPLEEIASVIGPVERVTANPNLDDAAQPAPGMLSRHYAPRTSLMTVLAETVAKPISGKRCGLLSNTGRAAEPGFLKVELLSEDGNLRTCASNFFAALRRLDAAGLDVIIAHQFPDSGLGLALNDRLKRAAAGSSTESGSIAGTL